MRDYGLQPPRILMLRVHPDVKVRARLVAERDEEARRGSDRQGRMEMSTLLGFVVGYVVGARQGPDGYARIRQKIDAMLDSPEFRMLVDRGAELSELLTSARNGSNGHASGPANGAREGAGVVDQLRGLLDGNGQLRATWQTIAGSELVQTALASGLSFAGDLFDRGKALLDERRGRPE